MSNVNYNVESCLDNMQSWLNNENDDFDFCELDFLDSELPSTIGVYRTSVPNGTLSPASSNDDENRKIFTTGRKKKNEELSMSKNAILARENRSKKKKFIEGLTYTVNDLKNENKILRQKCFKSDAIIFSLRKEINYLKNVITNQSTLSTLLRHIPGLLQENFNDSVKDDVIDIENVDDSESNSSEILLNASMQGRQTQGTTSDMSCGVCLHVANNVVQLELCSACNTEAQKFKKNQMKLNS
ncbi:hypothetical protein HELRODRAFT_167691 [Helobdella robusta]|uniref:BZIP domain-containing protein n=1 Tax=Helobdella robusta TaxID=6412 RepID=T1EZP2_HELRO|nr:hypothetical protein HELRODRAFT_167691 [Helobdella robusta]ESO09873.1 hypothetical protein HELRODRAFT_167691 [Helobdella robusta]